MNESTKDGNLTAEHLPIGAVVETKSGKTGVITHVHKKAGYLLIHNAKAGKTYHVSMASVTKVSGKSAADILSATENYWQSPAGKAILEAANKPKGDEDPIVASYPAQAKAWAALQSHGWSATKKDSHDGTVSFTHPKLGNTFQVDAHGTLTNLDSGTKLSPDEAAMYMDGFHANTAKQTEAAAKQKEAEGYTPEGKPTAGIPKGVSTDWKDYGKGDTVVSHDGKERRGLPRRTGGPGSGMFADPRSRVCGAAPRPAAARFHLSMCHSATSIACCTATIAFLGPPRAFIRW